MLPKSRKAAGWRMKNVAVARIMYGKSRRIF
jgi:hypothetical protein